MNQVLSKHTGAFECRVFRDISSPAEVNAHFEYAFIGHGYAVRAESLTTALATSGESLADIELRLLIIPATETDREDEFFAPKRHDIVYLMVGGGGDPVWLSFEIVDIEAPRSLPPFCRLYRCIWRKDLDLPDS